MKFVRFVTFSVVAVMLVGRGVAVAEGEIPPVGSEPMVLATDTYVQGAYSSLNTKKQDSLTNEANAGNNISIDDTTKKISLDLSGLPQVSGNSADGVYVLTATVVDGAATLKWELIQRSDKEIRNGEM